MWSSHLLNSYISYLEESLEKWLVFKTFYVRVYPASLRMTICGRKYTTRLEKGLYCTESVVTSRFFAVLRIRPTRERREESEPACAEFETFQTHEPRFLAGSPKSSSQISNFMQLDITGHLETFLVDYFFLRFRTLIQVLHMCKQRNAFTSTTLKPRCYCTGRRMGDMDQSPVLTTQKR